jgi:hypothetical protein
MVFTDSGVGEISKFMKGSTAVYPAYMAAGKGTTVAVIGDTALYSEEGRIAVTASRSNKTILYTGLFDSTKMNGTTVTEMGLFSNSTTGIMFTRLKHTDIDKTTSIEIQYDVIVRIGNPTPY